MTHTPLLWLATRYVALHRTDAFATLALLMAIPAIVSTGLAALGWIGPYAAMMMASLALISFLLHQIPFWAYPGPAHAKKRVHVGSIGAHAVEQYQHTSADLLGPHLPTIQAVLWAHPLHQRRLNAPKILLYTRSTAKAYYEAISSDMGREDFLAPDITALLVRAAYAHRGWRGALSACVPPHAFSLSAARPSAHATLAAQVACRQAGKALGGQPLLR